MTESGPPRVLWLIKTLGHGGAEQLLLTLASSRLDGHFEYEVAYVTPDMNTLVPRFRDTRMRVHLLGGGLVGLTWPLSLRRLMNSRTYAVVHSHSPYVAAGARLILRSIPSQVRPAHVYTEHSRWSAYRPLTRAANRLTYRWDDHRLVIADEVRQGLPTKHRDETETVIHGIKLDQVRSQRDQREEMRAQLGASPEEVLVGSVGNLRREKAHVVLVKAAARVMRRIPETRFVIVGTGDEENRIRRLCGRLGLDADRFSLMGYREDAVRIMSALDIYALSSDHEGLPVSVMEAQALGLPVVATKVGGLVSAIEHGRDGFLVPPRRPDLLADTIERLVSDPGLRARMAQQARARSARFDASVAFDRIEKIYHEVSGLDPSHQD